MAGIELIIFTGTCTMLWWFGFMMKIVAIMHYYFSCREVLIGSQGLFCFLYCPASQELWVHREMEGNTARTDDPDWPNGCPIPYGIMLSNKSWGNGGRRKRTFRLMMFILPRNHYTWWALLSWEWLSICALVGISKWILCPALLVHTQFLLYLVNCLYLNLWVLVLLLLDSVPHSTWGEWVSSCMVFSCIQGLIHHRSTFPISSKFSVPREISF